MLKGLQFYGTPGTLGNLPVTSLKPVPNAVVRALPMDMYDTERTGTSAITTINLFKAVAGQPFVNDSTNRKTLADTNMLQPGQFPAGQSFDLTGFQVKLLSLVAGTEISSTLFDQLFGYNTWLEMLIGDKLYARIPMSNLPTGTAKYAPSALYNGGITTTATLMNVSNGIPSSKEFYPYTLNLGGKTYKIHLVPTENFSININFGAAASFGTNVAVKVILKGILYNSI